MKRMASGGITVPISVRSKEESERIFDRAVEDGLKPKVRNIFVSFHVEDETQVNLLRHQAKDNQFGIHFRDYSVKEPFDEAWRRQCREKIALTSATIVMIGPKTAQRPAVIWEINESLRQGKKVIGVRIYKDRYDPIPKSLIENNCPIVEWNLAKISKLLEDD